MITIKEAREIIRQNLPSRQIEKMKRRRKLVITVAVLRGILLLSPPLNAALALTRLKPRDHLLGSAIGLVLPVGVIVFLAETALSLVRHLG